MRCQPNSLSLAFLCFTVFLFSFGASSAQESVIKLTTHMQPTDRFNVSIKYDGELQVEGAAGIESGGSTMWNGTINYQLVVQELRGDVSWKQHYDL